MLKRLNFNTSKLNSLPSELKMLKQDVTEIHRWKLFNQKPPIKYVDLKEPQEAIQE